MERLLEETSRRKRADILIKEIVHDDLASIPDIYEIVINVFHEEKIEYLLKNEDNTNRGLTIILIFLSCLHLAQLCKSKDGLMSNSSCASLSAFAIARVIIIFTC